MITDFTSVLFSVGMISGASSIFMGVLTGTASFLFLFAFMFLASFAGLVAYHLFIYFSCKLAEKLKIIEK
jgi:hypothetical protein